MSQILDRIREKYPVYKDIPDDELALWIGSKYPTYLEQDGDFKQEFQQAAGAASVQAAQQGVSTLFKVLTNPAAEEASAAGREQAMGERSLAVAEGISAPVNITQTLTKTLTAGAEGSAMAREQASFMRLLGQEGKAPQNALERAARNWQMAGMATAPVNTGAKPIDIGGTKINPTEGVQLPTVTPPPEAGVTEKVAAGLWNVGTSLVNFGLSPEGIATMIAPEALPAKYAEPLLKGIFAGLMAKSSAEALGKASVTHDPQDITEAVAELGLMAPLGYSATFDVLQERRKALGLLPVKPPIRTLVGGLIRKVVNAKFQQMSQVAPATAEALKAQEMAGVKFNQEGTEDLSARPIPGAAGMQVERITAASYTDPKTGKTTTGQNHPEAAKAQGVEAPAEPTQRHGQEYGFEVWDPKTGTRRYVSRDEAESIARLNGQLLEEPKRGKLHSDEVDFFKPEEQGAAAEPSPDKGKAEGPKVIAYATDTLLARTGEAKFDLNKAEKITKIVNDQGKEVYAIQYNEGDQTYLVFSDDPNIELHEKYAGESPHYAKEFAALRAKQEKGAQDAIHREASPILRDVQQPEKPEKGPGQMPADETGKDTGQGSGEVPQKAPEVAETPTAKIERVSKMTPAEFSEHAKKVGRFTVDAYQTGAAITSPEDVIKLRKAQRAAKEAMDALHEKIQKAQQEKKPDEAIKLMEEGLALGSQMQWYNEAIEAATGARGDTAKLASLKEALGPDYKAPFPEQPPAQPKLSDFEKSGNFFKAFSDAMGQWRGKVAEWLKGYPENKPLIFRTEHNVYAITKDPKGGWRYTYFSAKDKMPSGHQEFKTREEAVSDFLQHNEDAVLIPKMPFTPEPLPARLFIGDKAIWHSPEGDKLVTFNGFLGGDEAGKSAITLEDGTKQTVANMDLARAPEPKPAAQAQLESDQKKIDEAKAKAAEKEKPAEPEKPAEEAKSRSARAINKDIRAAKENIRALKGQERDLRKSKNKGGAEAVRQKIVEAQNKLAELEGELSRAPKQPSRGGSVAERQFEKENSRVGDDTLRWINENTGGIMSWAAFKEEAKRRGKEWFDQNKWMWDDIQGVKLPVHHNHAIYGGTSMPDQIAQELFNAGKLKDAHPSALWEAIRHDSEVRKSGKKVESAEEKALSAEEQEHVNKENFQKEAVQNQDGARVEVDPTLSLKGDTYELGGQKLRVIDRNQETGAITIDGGEKFGRFTVTQEDPPFYVDSIIEAEPGAGDVEFLPPEDREPEKPTTPEPEKPKAPKPATDLFGNPVEEPGAGPAKHPELGNVEPRPLTKAEREEFQDLSIKARRAREENGPALTTEETKRYDYLTALAGQKELLAEDTTGAKKGRIATLRSKLTELERQRALAIERAQSSYHRREEYIKEAGVYDQQIKDIEKQIFDLNQQLPVADREFNNPNPPSRPRWEGKATTGQKMRIWGKAKGGGGELYPDWIVEFAGDPRERHTQEWIENVTGKLMGDLLTEGMKFKAGDKVKTSEDTGAREGEIASSGPYKDGEQHYFVKTNLGETLYPESKLEARAEEPPKVAEPPQPAAEPEKPKKYRIGNNPQTYTLLERLPASDIERQNGEQPMRVRNDKTGREEIVMESDLEPVKERSKEEKAADKGKAKDLDAELRAEGLDPSVFSNAKEKREALRRAREKKGGPGTPSIYQGPDPKAQIEQLHDAFKGVRGRKLSLREQLREAFNLGERLSAARDMASRAVAGLKSTGDYLIDKWAGYNQIDDLLRAKGELSAELEQRGWRLRQFVATIEKNIPDKAQRAAIAKWVDAGGDLTVLQDGLNNAPNEYKQAYQDAMNLSGDLLVAAHNIRNYFDSRLQEAIDAGVLESGVEDYIHRLYERDPAQAQQLNSYIQSGILSGNPRLAKKRIFTHDWEAEALGYKVVQDFLPRLTTYESSLSRAIAAREFIGKAMGLRAKDGRPVIDVAGIGIPIEDQSGVRESTLIKPSVQVRDEANPMLHRGDYKKRDYPALRKWKWVTEDADGNPIMVQGDLIIHPKFASRIDALLKPSAVRFGENERLQKIGRAALGASTLYKQTMLDLSGFHQVQIMVHGMEHGVFGRPISEIDFTSPDVQGLMKGGVTLGGDYFPRQAAEGLIGRSLTQLVPGLSQVLDTYHSWLFQSFIPRIKMTMALNALERNKGRYKKELAKGKMTLDDIYHLTAGQANAAFGELNYTMLERSKTWQDISRIALLAPDFLEARARFVGQALTKHGDEQRKALLMGALTLYTLARVGNMLLDGQPHFEPENAFSIIKGNKAYSLRTVQGDVLHLLTHPLQFWMSRLNPVYGRTMLEAASGRDYFGRKRSPAEQVWDFVSTAMPISLRTNSERSLWESMINAFGVTARRYSDMDDAFKMAQKWKDKHGVTMKGEFIYDASKDPLRGLKVALSNDDEGKAAQEIKKLVDSKQFTIAKLNEYFNRLQNMPFTGSAANDKKFYEGLSEDEKKTVDAARQHKRGLNQLYRKSRDQYKAAIGQKPSEEDLGQ